MKTLFLLRKILNKKEKRGMILLLVLMIIGTGVELLGVSLILPVVNIITNPDVINSGYYKIIGDLFNADTVSDFVICFSLILIIVYILKNIFLIIEYNFQYKYVYNGQKELMERLLKCYLNEDYSFHVNHNPSVLLRNTTTDVGTTYETVQAFLQLLTESMVCVALIVYLLYTDFISTSIICLILLIFVAIFGIIYKKYSYKVGVDVREAHADEIKWVNQSLYGIKELKVTDTEKYFIERFKKASSDNASARRKQSMLSYISKPVMETVMICGLLIVILVKLFIENDINGIIPIVSVFVVSAYRMLPSFNRITQSCSVILYGVPSVEAVFNELEKFKIINNNELVENKIVDLFESNIYIENLSFRYDNSDKNILKDVSFIIEDKKSTAIIGESGAGKSTFADLLLGVLKPLSGDIKYGEISIYENLYSWHRSIGYIPQTIYLMDDNILRNVAFGIEDKDIDENRVWEALKEAQLDEFVKSLPNGLYNEVGDRGVKLSGGQRQRIGIARALYSNPKILIMDEATSALDNETENELMEAIDSMHGNRTIIIIAHRLSTIRNCDKIYKISNGIFAETK